MGMKTFSDEELISHLRLQGLDKDVAAADRIEQLLESIKGLSQAWATVAVAREVSEGKLVKAVETLRQILMDPRSADQTYVELWADTIKEIRAVLAELEKTE